MKAIWVVIILALLGAEPGLGAPPPATVPLARDASAVAGPGAAGPVYLRDLAEGSGGTISTGVLTAKPGRYRLHAPLAMHPLGDAATAWLTVQLRAGAQARTLNSLAFSLADEFVDATLDFTATTPQTTIGVNWSFEGDAATLARAKSTVTPAAPGLESGQNAGKESKDDSIDLEDREGLLPIERAKALATCLLLRPAFAEPLSPVAITAVQTNKITYKRGEQGQADVQLHNAAATPETVTLAAELQSGLDQAAPVKTQTLTIAPGATAAWPIAFPTQSLSWGCSLRVTATIEGFPAESAKAVFAVPNHFWDVAIMAHCPAQMTKDFTTMERARQAAAQLKEEGYNGFEAYFWAPCDFLDYTPTTERFYSGQTAYVQSSSGTRNIIAACHELGIVATFYANLWGGSGEPAFEVMRKHPEWFGTANFHSGALDDAALMTAGVIRGPGHKVWSYNQINNPAPMSVFDYHVDQILGSHKMFGWDGIRYDSYYSAQWTIKAMTHVRQRMSKECPEFIFGYNAFADAEWRVGAMDSLSGGMIMAEGLRVGRGSRVVDYVRGLNAWREVAWPYDSAIGPLYGFTGGQDDKKALPATPLDHIWMSSAIIAAGGHPYYGQMENQLGEHPAFALRYAEYLYNPRMRAPLQPDSVVTFPKGVEPLAWRTLLRTVTLGDGCQRLVLHVLNAPEGTALGQIDMKHAPPLRNLDVAFHLPAGAKPSGAWLLQAVPAAEHHPLQVTPVGDAFKVMLPEVRFYGVVVLEFSSPTAIPEATDAKTLRERQPSGGTTKAREN